MNVAKMNRAELEVEILQNDIEETVFGGLDAIGQMTDEQLREKLIQWVIEGNETDF